LTKESTKLKYHRVLLKLSGEALMGNQGFGIDPEVIKRISSEIKQAVDQGIQVAVVIGGGNLFRGALLSQEGLDRVSADHMGMLATLMNALAMRDIFEQMGMSTRVMSAIPMSGIVDHYDRRKAMHHLMRNRVVIFAAGTGNPLVTTDSAASLRGIEVKADIIIKGTNVDGVYSADPQKDPKAVLYDKLTFDQVLAKQLGVMDLSAFCQCRDQGIPLCVFNINKQGMLLEVLLGKKVGTLVTL
jgi:uridylate kinase